MKKIHCIYALSFIIISALSAPVAIAEEETTFTNANSQFSSKKATSQSKETAQAIPLSPPEGPNFTPPTAHPPLPDNIKEVLERKKREKERISRTHFKKRGHSQEQEELHVAQGINLDDDVGTIRFSDLATNDALEMLESLTGLPILRHQGLGSISINFYSQGTMTRKDAIIAIESLLSLNGIAITPVGDKFLKAIPIATVNNQVPILWEGSTLNATPSQKIYSKIFHLDFLSEENVMSMIQPLMSQGTPITTPKANAILITDTLINLQRIESILKEIDKPSSSQIETIFYPLKNATAQDVLSRLNNLRSSTLGKKISEETVFDIDDRTNQLIIVTHPKSKAIILDLIKKFDVDIAPFTETEIFDIKHAEATIVAQLIKEIATGQIEKREQKKSRVQQRNRRVEKAKQEAMDKADNLQFSDILTITADERANTIIASGTRNDIKAVSKLIDKIDTVLPQVRVEVVITEVSLEEGDARGIDSFGLTYNTDGYDSDTGSFSANSGKNFVINPFNLYGLGVNGITTGPNGFSIEAVLNTAMTKSNVTVLSAPTIVTTHNREAVISIGERRPVVTGTQTDSSNTAVTYSSVEYEDISLELKVKPLIGSNGAIQMEIEQTKDDVTGYTNIESIGDQPIIGSTKMTSFVSVQDGGMVVLGGLQKVNKEDYNGRMGILGRIPLLGKWLFSRKEESETRRELLVFIRPVIVKTTAEATEDAKFKISQLQDKKPVEQYFETGTFTTEEKEEKKVSYKRNTLIRGGKK